MGPLAILCTFSATVFFTPHANSQEFANAFGLGYRDVNYSLLYAAFGFLTLVALSLFINIYYKLRLIFSLILYLIGTILFGISYWFKGNKRFFFTAQILIGCNFCILLVMFCIRGFTLTTVQEGGNVVSVLVARAGEGLSTEQRVLH